MTDPADVLEGRSRWCVVAADCLNAPSRILWPRGRVHVVSDPPYSAHTHGNMRGNRGEAGIVVRNVGFGHLEPRTRRFIAQWATGNATGWIALFTDRESSWLWRLSINAAGGSYKRSIPWIRWSSPQFHDMCPPSGAEDVVFSNGKGKGAKWVNGGRTHYFTKCLRASNKDGEHETEKPVGLMLDILDDIGCEENDLVVDLTCGSATTGVAALRRGASFLGYEKLESNADTARQRLAAERQHISLRAAKAGQTSLFEVDHG